MTPRFCRPSTLVLLAIFLASAGAQAQEAASTGEAATIAGGRHHPGSEESDESPVAVPSNIFWIRAEVLAIMWIFIAAILLGPIVMYFNPESAKSPQHHPSRPGHETATHH